MFVSFDDIKDKVKIRQKGDQDGYASVPVTNICEKEVECEVQVTQQENFQITPSKFTIKCDDTVEVKIRSKHVSNNEDLSQLS